MATEMLYAAVKLAAEELSAQLNDVVESAASERRRNGGEMHHSNLPVIAELRQQLMRLENRVRNLLEVTKPAATNGHKV